MRDAGIPDQKRLLVWTDDDLSSLGSFEQSLVRLAEALQASGWELRICCGNAVAPEVADALANVGASVRAREASPADTFETFTRECLLYRPNMVGSPSHSLSNIARSLGAATITTNTRRALTDESVEDPSALSETLRRLGATFH